MCLSEPKRPVLRHLNLCILKKMLGLAMTFKILSNFIKFLSSSHWKGEVAVAGGVDFQIKVHSIKPTTPPPAPLLSQAGELINWAFSYALQINHCFRCNTDL